MIRFEKLAPTEKTYPFVNAVSDAKYKNGTFGTVTNGVFSAGKSFMAIMQVEKGNDMNTTDFVVNKDEQVRIADFSKVDGCVVNITLDQIDGEYAAGDKLIADEDGNLAVSATVTKNYFKIIEVTRYGVRAIAVVGE